MVRMVYEVLGVSVERTEELCQRFLAEGGELSSDVIRAVMGADLSEQEKMVVVFAVGFMSALDFATEPSTFLKSNNYIH